jgi:hypothetical protein
MRRTSKVLSLCSMLGSLVFGSSALATDGSEVDLTGTWEGEKICDQLNEGESRNFVLVDDVLLVIQDGDTFRFVDLLGTQPEIPDDIVYEGVIQNVEGSNNLEALAGICGGDFKAQEIVRLRRIAISETEAHFDAESVFFTDDFLLFEGNRIFATCKWAYERVSTELPEVPRCQRPGIRPTR